MANIKHIKGNLFDTDAPIIMHQVNCKGVMGSGVAKQVKERFPKAYRDYKKIVDDKEMVLLGYTQTVFNNEKCIVNLFGQDGYGRDRQHTDLKKLRQSLNALEYLLRLVAPYSGAKQIAMPYKMGSDRGGADWKLVLEMIEEVFEYWSGDILIYEL